ncbi:gluconate 2-dehydrogenase subunit 3 family protein [Rhizobium leguminosarum]|uniref:gluconate 2-dehydrogenase subunit 3 family protein n=1 Tax=Rhizobium leguminosarum TaxID=384 RepID=UPI003F966BF2
MRITDRLPQTTRRGFLCGGTAVVVSAVALGRVYASEEVVLFPGEDGGKMLVQVARDIYPHDRLTYSHYATAVGNYDGLAAKDPAIGSLIDGGLRQLNTLSNEKFGMPYLQLSREEDRVGLLKAIETTPFFQRLRGDLIMTLYNNKEVWPVLGYEGASVEYGGYIDRGFDDIDWL